MKNRKKSIYCKMLQDDFDYLKEKKRKEFVETAVAVFAVVAALLALCAPLWRDTWTLWQ